MLTQRTQDAEKIKQLKAEWEEAEGNYRRLENLYIGVPGQVLVIRMWNPGDYRRLYDAERKRDECMRLYHEAAGIPAR